MPDGGRTDSVKVARATWREGLHFQATLPSGIALEMGSDADNARARPKELLLGALMGCTGMDVVSILEKMRAPFTAFHLTAEGVERDTHPKIYDTIVLTYSLEAPEASKDGFARAVELSWTKYCPVIATLREASRLTYRLELNGATFKEGA